MKISLTRVLLVVAVVVAMFALVQTMTVWTHTPVAQADCTQC
jgi:hypothetical protein